jgi:predicted DNA-binding antitoxin AbrB/MazE fold protein
MAQTIKAVYNGRVFEPQVPVDLPAGTEVEVTVLAAAVKTGEPHAWMRLLAEAHLDGPSDWSENVDKYRFGWGAEDGE